MKFNFSSFWTKAWMPWYLGKSPKYNIPGVYKNLDNRKEHIKFHNIWWMVTEIYQIKKCYLFLHETRWMGPLKVILILLTKDLNTWNFHCTNINYPNSNKTDIEHVEYVSGRANFGLSGKCWFSSTLLLLRQAMWPRWVDPSVNA